MVSIPLAHFFVVLLHKNHFAFCFFPRCFAVFPRFSPKFCIFLAFSFQFPAFLQLSPLSPQTTSYAHFFPHFHHILCFQPFSPPLRSRLTRPSKPPPPALFLPFRQNDDSPRIFFVKYPHIFVNFPKNLLSLPLYTPFIPFQSKENIFWHPPRSATDRRPRQNAPLLCFCQMKPQRRRSENRSQVRAFPDCSAHPWQIGRSSPPKPRSAHSDKVGVSFGTHLGLQPAGDLAQRDADWTIRTEAIYEYCESEDRSKQKKNTIKDKKERAQLVCALSSY